MDAVMRKFDLAEVRKKIVAPLFCIYGSPADYPNKFVVRLWDADKPTNTITLSDTLAEARRTIPDGLMCFTRSLNDDSCIVETWI